MITRLVITLSPDEGRALENMAATSLRGPKAELRHLLRREATRLGLLIVSAEAPESEKTCKVGGNENEE